MKNIYSRRRIIVIVLLILSFVLALVLPFYGAAIKISPASVFGGHISQTEFKIFWKVRIPRIILGWLVGACLALSGMVFQAVFRNPLATPFTLGVSSGASFGAAIAVKLGFVFSIAGLSGVTITAFGGAILTVSLIYFFTSLRRDFSAETMLLAGVALSFFFSAAILVVQYLSDFTSSFQLVRWLMGNLNTVGYEKVIQLSIMFILTGIIIIFLSRDLNLIFAGDELAVSRGVNVERTKIILFFAVSLVTGAVVAFCGPIGFVGMMIPYFLRLLMGPEHRSLAFASVFGGATFLVAIDFICRTLIAPAEIPVGVLTALVGGPFFLWLLIARKETRFFI